MRVFFFCLLLSVSSLQAQDCSVDTLKTMFTLVSQRTVVPKEQSMLAKMLKNNKIDSALVSSINKIDAYLLKGKPNKEKINPSFEYLIWEFNKASNAKKCFKIMSDLMSNSYYEKPMKLFFLNENKLYYFGDMSMYVYQNYGRKAYDKVLDSCFKDKKVEK